MWKVSELPNSSQNLFLFLDKNPGTKAEIEVSEQICDRIYMEIYVIILKNLSEILLSDIYRIARKMSKNDEDMVKIFAI